MFGAFEAQSLLIAFLKISNYKIKDNLKNFPENNFTVKRKNQCVEVKKSNLSHHF